MTLEKLNIGGALGKESPEKQIMWSTIHAIIFSVVALVLPVVGIIAGLFLISLVIGLLRLIDAVDSIWPWGGN